VNFSEDMLNQEQSTLEMMDRIDDLIESVKPPDLIGIDPTQWSPEKMAQVKKFVRDNNLKIFVINPNGSIVQSSLDG